MEYLQSAEDVYKEAAQNTNVCLTCMSIPSLKLPELVVPNIMEEMNYGCGTTVHPQDLVGSPKILYLGVGCGLELLQFSYFSRRSGAIVGVDIVEEMLDTCRKNFVEAEELNSWFRSEFVELRKGDALNLPLEDQTFDVAAQNGLFNIFKVTELKKALSETYRVLKPGGRLLMSDPVCDKPIPKHLQENERLRACCLSGAFSLQEYIGAITGVGFGRVDIRAKRTYRVLDPKNFGTDELLVLESIEVCAMKVPMSPDGPSIFSGKTATYFGTDACFDDGKGNRLPRNQPLAVCDRTATELTSLNRDDIYISKSTYFYDGGGRGC